MTFKHYLIGIIGSMIISVIFVAFLTKFIDTPLTDIQIYIVVYIGMVINAYYAMIYVIKKINTAKDEIIKAIKDKQP